MVLRLCGHWEMGPSDVVQSKPAMRPAISPSWARKASVPVKSLLDNSCDMAPLYNAALLGADVSKSSPVWFNAGKASGVRRLSQFQWTDHSPENEAIPGLAFAISA